MNKKRIVGRLLTVLTACHLSLATSSAQISVRLDADSPLRKLQIAELAVANLYVDSVDEQKLVEDGIRGMLEKLDPHSSYSTPKEVKQLNEPLQGNFEGIGVQFNMVEDTLLVIQTVSGGPSEKMGILAGDRIVTVNDTAIAGVKMSRDEIMRRLRGPKGTKVRLGIVRPAIKDVLAFVITRDKIPVHSIDATYMLRPGIGYIRVGNFGATTHEEFCESLKSLLRQGMRALVLDLQENGGGYLHAAVQMANEFLQEDDLIVYTEGRKTPRVNYSAKGGGLFPAAPDAGAGSSSAAKPNLVILVDSYTASAAEIVSGAVQDNDRGVIIGRRTFGKGLVQRPIDLPDGSMIRLTVSHYYTPSGRCIQKPYEKGKQRDYAMDVMNRLRSGELMSADSIHFADSLRYYTLRQRRVVYGGGGIMPDEYVPLDTTKYTRFHRQLAAKGITITQNLRYVDNHRKQLKSDYPAFSEFQQRFEIPESLIEAIVKEGEKQGVKPADDEELRQSLPLMRLQLKALVARDLWSMNEFYTIMNEENDVVRRALQFLNTK